MKYPASIRCWDSIPQPSEHESTPITTKPRLPPSALQSIFLKKMGQSRSHFVYFRLFYMTQNKYILIKALMVCLGLEPGRQDGRHMRIH